MTAASLYGNPAIYLVSFVFATLLHWETGVLSNQYAHYAGVLLILVALYLAWRRGGWAGAPFLVSAVFSYPLLSPFIAIDVLGVQYFSGYAVFVQRVDVYGPLVFLGAMAILYVSLSVELVKYKEDPIGVRYSIRRESLFFLMLVSCVLAMVFAYIGDAAEITIVSESYGDVVQSRNKAFAFAGGAWSVLMTIALLLYLHAGSERRGGRDYLVAGVFYAAVVISAAYLLLHGRRVELTGFVLVVLLLLGTKGMSWRLLLLAVPFVFALDFVGTVRVGDVGLQTSMGGQQYDSLPGGVGNVMAGYVAGYWLVENEVMDMFYGSTYFDHLLRLPPVFLGLERPPLAYDYVENYFVLVGGEYFLLEPLLNFGVIGTAVFSVLVVMLINWSIRGLGVATRGGAIRIFVSATFISMLFRTAWYGITPLIKALIIAAILGAVFEFAITSRAKKDASGLYP